MKERYLLEEEVGENGFSLITDYDGNDEHVFDVNIKSGDILPVLPLRNMVLFPILLTLWIRLVVPTNREAWHGITIL